MSSESDNQGRCRMKTMTDKGWDNCVYRAAFDKSTLGLLIVDGACRCVEVNPTGAQLLGVTRRRLINRKIWKLLTPSRRHKPEFAIAEGSRQYELRFLQPNGETTQISVRTRPYFFWRTSPVCSGGYHRTEGNKQRAAQASATIRFCGRHDHDSRSRRCHYILEPGSGALLRLEQD